MSDHNFITCSVVMIHIYSFIQTLQLSFWVFPISIQCGTSRWNSLYRWHDPKEVNDNCGVIIIHKSGYLAVSYFKLKSFQSSTWKLNTLSYTFSFHHGFLGLCIIFTPSCISSFQRNGQQRHTRHLLQLSGTFAVYLWRSQSKIST